MYKCSVSVFRITTRVLLLSYIGNCSPDHDSRRRSSVSTSQTVWLQEFLCPPSDQHTTISKTCFHQKTQQISNEIWLDTPGIANDNGLESMEYTLQGPWLGAVLEVTDVLHFVVSPRYQMPLKFLPQAQYVAP
ncbi:hypothetical protein TNCV_2358771 [Trichonephila clavipes]|nr:hypothetical protein TNCV_2358771 [Trichonephila clavipes]